MSINEDTLNRLNALRREKLKLLDAGGQAKRIVEIEHERQELLASIGLDNSNLLR